jgi:hypothetical protein
VKHGSPPIEADNAASSGPDPRWRFLRGEVDRQLALFGRRRRRDKRKAFALQMATVTLSAVVTVLLGLRTSESIRTVLLNIAFVLGALITVLATAEAFFTHRRLWVLRTATVRRLETLSRHVDFNTAGADGKPADASTLAASLAELDAIIEDDLKAWHQMHESPPSAHGTRLPGTADPPQPGTPSDPTNIVDQ